MTISVDLNKLALPMDGKWHTVSLQIRGWKQPKVWVDGRPLNRSLGYPAGYKLPAAKRHHWRRKP